MLKKRIIKANTGAPLNNNNALYFSDFLQNYNDNLFNNILSEGILLPANVGVSYNSSNILGLNFTFASGTNLGKFSLLFNKANAGSTGSLLGTASDLIGNLVPQRPEYEGKKGGVTKTLDTVYDTTANTLLSSGNPYGMLAGGLMKANGVVSDVVGNLGGGTDGLTTFDAITGSSFFSMTPIGLINGFGGKRTIKFSKDLDTWEDLGSAYSGTLDKVNAALEMLNKKYGLFSSRARRKANSKIKEAKRLLTLVAGINDEAQDAFNASNYEGIALGNQLALSGGYKSLYVGKDGMKFKEYIEKNKPELEFALTISNTAIIYPINKDLTSIEAYSDAIKNDTYIEIEDSQVIDFIKKYSINKFKEGGLVNVIPDGYLHAHKHHMEELGKEFEDITKKGIPVVTEENGELVLQAEVEKEEIIYRLEVTKKLEELSKIFFSKSSTLKEKDEAAILAGKLLVFETLENTIDNANLIEKVT